MRHRNCRKNSRKHSAQTCYKLFFMYLGRGIRINCKEKPARKHGIADVIKFLEHGNSKPENNNAAEHAEGKNGGECFLLFLFSPPYCGICGKDKENAPYSTYGDKGGL